MVLSTDAVLEKVKCERLEEIAIDGDWEKFFQVGTQLPPREKEELLAFLRRILMYSHGMLMKLLGWIQTSFAII